MVETLGRGSTKNLSGSSRWPASRWRDTHRGDADELAASKAAPDIDVDSEFRDDMVLETSPEGAGATDGVPAQNEGEDHLASGEDDLPVRQEVGAALSKVMKLPKIAQRPPFSSNRENA